MFTINNSRICTAFAYFDSGRRLACRDRPRVCPPPHDNSVYRPNNIFRSGDTYIYHVLERREGGQTRGLSLHAGLLPESKFILNRNHVTIGDKNRLKIPSHFTTGTFKPVLLPTNFATGTYEPVLLLMNITPGASKPVLLPTNSTTGTSEMFL